MKKYLFFLSLVLTLFAFAKSVQAEESFLSFNGCIDGSASESNQPDECRAVSNSDGLMYQNNILFPNINSQNYSSLTYSLNNFESISFQLKTHSTSTTPGETYNSRLFFVGNGGFISFQFNIDTLNNLISGYSTNGTLINSIQLIPGVFNNIKVSWTNTEYTICINSINCSTGEIGTYKPPVLYMDLQITSVNQTNHNKSFEISQIEYTDFDSVHIINLDEDGSVKVGLEAPFKAYSRTCIIGTDCQLQVGYGFQSIGKILNFKHAEDDSLISTTTLTDQPVLKTSLTVPNESFSAKFYYCLSIDFGYVNPTWTGVHEDCTYSVKWVTQEYFDEHIAPGLAEFDIESACDTVATSTGEMWDDFRYGLECGFRKAVYWATVPSPETYYKIESSKESLMLSFPFTYYRQVQRIVYNMSSATSTPYTVNMGTFIHDDFSSGYNDKEILSASMFQKNLGDKWDLIQTTMKYFVYILLGLYLVKRLISMSSQEKSA